MNPDRFQEAKRIYTAALEREPAEREAYVSEACAGDESLRKEVESLLGCRAEAQEFFKAPAVEAGAKALARDSHRDFTGSTLSHYAIVEKIGEGGMGVVYKARDTHLDRDVAIKVLPAGMLADETARSRFRREALTLSHLSHPSLAVVHDFDSENGVDFLAMEYVAGETLAAKVASGQLSERDVITLGTQIAEALEEAHEHKVIHRDLKPSNVMVTAKGRVKVLDFGLAKLVKPAGAEADAATASLTGSQPGAVMGTLPYMAPEQLQGKTVDARADIYALGAVLYEMVTGQRPFREKQSTPLIASILTEPPHRRVN